MRNTVLPVVLLAHEVGEHTPLQRELLPERRSVVQDLSHVPTHIDRRPSDPLVQQDHHILRTAVVHSRHHDRVPVRVSVCVPTGTPLIIAVTQTRVLAT